MAAASHAPTTIREQYDEVKAVADQVRASRGDDGGDRLGDGDSIIAHLLAASRGASAMEDDTPDVLSEITDTTYSADERLAFLLSFRQTLDAAADLARALHEPADGDELLSALTAVATLLTVQEVFVSPIERRKVSTELVALMEFVVEADVCAVLAALLDDADAPAEVVYQAARATAFLAPGARIANLPHDNLLHPAHFTFKKMLVSAGVVEPLAARATAARAAVNDDGGADGRVRDQLLLALAAIALEFDDARQYVLRALLDNDVARRQQEHRATVFATGVQTAGSAAAAALVAAARAEAADAGGATAAAAAAAAATATAAGGGGGGAAGGGAPERKFSFGVAQELILRHELAKLAEETHFSRGEVEKLFAAWGGKTEQIGQDAFAAGLAEIGITDPVVVAQNFSAFDHDRSGTIDFREYILALSVMKHGDEDERLELIFQSYDLDKSGTLDPDEVYAIYRTALLFSGEDPDAAHVQLVEKVREVFDSVDADGDGAIDFDEFKAGVKANAILAECFVQCPV